MFSDEEVFLMKMDTLAEIGRNPTLPNSLTASAIFRLFFLDENAIVPKLAKTHKFKLRFRVADTPPLPADRPGPYPDRPLRLVAAFQDLNPSWRHPTKEVALAELLATWAHVHEAKRYTVRDIIDYTANVGGGVHQSKPKRESQKNIHAGINGGQIMEQPFPIFTIGWLTKLVLDTLEPLEQRIRAQRSPCDPSMG